MSHPASRVHPTMEPLSFTRQSLKATLVNAKLCRMFLLEHGTGQQEARHVPTRKTNCLQDQSTAVAA